VKESSGITNLRKTSIWEGGYNKGLSLDPI